MLTYVAMNHPGKVEGNSIERMCHQARFLLRPEWALQDSNLRLQPCEWVPILFMERLRATRHHLTRNDQDARRLVPTAHYAICGAFCGEKRPQLLIG